MKTKKYSPQIRAFNIALLFIGMLFASTTFACSTAAWLGGASGAVNPNDPTNSVARVKGLCGLELTGTGHVQDGSPAAETSFIGHFYFYPEFTGSGSTDLFVAYSDEGATTAVITISYDGTDITLDASAIGGSSTSVAAVNGWNLVEFAWESGTTGNLWVNADATIDTPSATFTPGTGSIDAVRLGSPNSFGGLEGSATFDEYVSNRTQPVGMLLAGDANLDGNINSGDIDLVVGEFLSSTLADGVPDCNMDGSINSGDIDCIVAIFLGS